MKIAHVVSTFYPRIGGMGKVAYEEARGLAGLGYDVTVFTPRYGQKNKKEERKGFKIERLFAPFRSSNGALVPSLFFKLRKFDLVHLHYPFYGGMHLVYLACLFFGKKLVVTYHMDATTTSMIQKIIKLIYDFLFSSRIFRKADKIISVGDDFITNKKIMKLAQGKKIEIANGVDIEVFQKQKITDPDLLKYSDKKIFLFVGNLMAIKRLDLLISAMQNIQNKDAILIVVGGGYLIEQYKKEVANLNLSDRVIFAGSRKSPQKLSQYYNVAICTVVPSEYESFSLVSIESLACQTPVIVSNIPGARQRVEENKTGFLFEPNSATDLQKKMETVLNYEQIELDKMGSFARKIIEEKYSWQIHIGKLDNVYKSL